MSEELYIKAPCCECNGRVSLPLDAVGVDFNCPHCGAELQMLLKHVCEHCNGKLSFDGNPDAIGAEIECGHCNNKTVLSPSTYSPQSAGGETAEPVKKKHEEIPDYSTEKNKEEEAVEEKPKDRGPPRPRAPRRGAGPPRPRSRKTDTPEQAPAADPNSDEPIGRRLPGSEREEVDGPDVSAKTEEKSTQKSKRTGPVRSSKIQSVDEARAPSPRRGGVSPPPEPEQSVVSGGNPMDPMSGVVPGGSGEKAQPSGGGGSPSSPAPVQRRVAGSAPAPGSSPSAPKPAFREGAKPPEVKKSTVNKAQVEEERGPRSMPKWATVLAVILILLGFVYIILPSGVEIFSPQLARKIRQFTRFQFGHIGGPSRRDSTKDFQIDEGSVTITPSSATKEISYVTGSIQNISSADYTEVTVNIGLYDAGGTLLDHTLDYTNRLGANQTWTFKAALSLTNAASAKVVSVIGNAN